LFVSRTTLCDVLDALADHRDALVVVGSHAVHERTAGVMDYSTSTKDADIAVVPVLISAGPTIEDQLRGIGLRPLCEIVEHPAHRRYTDQPGLWGKGFDDNGQPVSEVDLLVPAALSGGATDDSDQAPPATAHHGSMATRATSGIELAASDRELLSVTSFADGSVRRAWVAGIPSLLCAKTYKLHDRVTRREKTGRDRVVAKDGGDIWRLMAASDPESVATTFGYLADDDQVGPVAQTGVARLRQLINSGELRTLALDDLDDGGTGEVSDVYYDWTHTFMAATGRA